MCEDYHLVLPDAGLVLLADGISGREGAAVASQLAVHAVHACPHQQSWDASWPGGDPAEQAAKRLRVAMTWRAGSCSNSASPTTARCGMHRA